MLIGTIIPLFTGLGLEAWTAEWERRLDFVNAQPTAWKVANGLIIIGAVVTVVGIALVADLLRSLDSRQEAAVRSVGQDRPAHRRGHAAGQ